MSAPFIVYLLPRSRGYWLYKLLTYGDFHCSHEQIRHVRSMEDVRSWLSQDDTGTVETGAARWWRIVQHYRPDIRTLVVRRPVDEVVDSLMRLDFRGLVRLDRAALTHQMHRLDRCLDRIEHNVPGAMSVRFADLAHEDVCAAAFEHCTLHPHDHDWWTAWDAVNAQADMTAMARYSVAHAKQIGRMARSARQQMRMILTVPKPAEAPDCDGMTFQEERFDTFFRDGAALFAQHCSTIDEPGDQFFSKNIPLARALDVAGKLQIVTARSNGRMFGYLMTVVGPTLVAPDRLTATQTTPFVSPDAPGLMMRLQHASLDGLRARGVDDVIFQAAVAGDGPRLGVVARRLKAKPHGQVYRLVLKAA